MNHRNQSSMQDPRMIVGGGEGTFVDGINLKPVDVANETVLGFASGLTKGALISSVVSLLLSVAENKGAAKTPFQAFSENVTGKHLIGVLLASTAFGALGAFTQNSRARMHNQWRNEHYQFLEHQEQQGAQVGFAGREDARRSQTASAVNER